MPRALHRVWCLIIICRNVLEHINHSGFEIDFKKRSCDTLPRRLPKSVNSLERWPDTALVLRRQGTWETTHEMTRTNTNKLWFVLFRVMRVDRF